jgi:hypothetical protein
MVIEFLTTAELPANVQWRGVTSPDTADKRTAP